MMEFLYLIGAFVLFGVISSLYDHRKMKRLALERGEPNICEFSRTFDYRQIDTKILREVWNETQINLGTYAGKNFPIKAEDLFEQTYNFDSDDLDEIYWVVADRLGIDTENPEENPYWNKVDSVKDLVLLLHYQPKLKRE
jgi:hypothetical protein